MRSDLGCSKAPVAASWYSSRASFSHQLRVILFDLVSIDMSKVLGVFVIARNGDREEFPQDPKTYEPGRTRSTPLGAVSVVMTFLLRGS